MGDSQSWFLWLYRTMKVLTIAIAVFLIVANVMILIKLRPDSVDGVMALLLRVYNIIFAFIMMICEFEHKYILESIKFLAVWPGRGMFHMFCGILTLGSGSLGDETVNIIKDISGWCAIAVGVLYVIFGLMCLHSWKEKLEEKERKRNNK
ncbi:hypothetical protein M0813_15410 [Anaeramoeba flamelloides]|uniref:COPI associated protein n=1 Tax=Anaeramoeba flamelloides TaxID=1746091 RepID=A0ABQ8Z1I8_9EUKA|nr:hypothetical protein M0813_15410 [Anaeramoeba flamelloides]